MKEGEFEKDKERFQNAGMKVEEKRQEMIERQKENVMLEIGRKRKKTKV